MIDYHFSWHADGQLSGERNTDFELVQAHLMARHGDRSPVYLYVIGSPLYYDCGLQDNNDGSRWTRLKDFPKPRKLSFRNKRTYYTNQPIFPGARSKPCGMGKLTRTGYYQHKALGLQMWKKYSKALLLHNMTDQALVKSMFVQSTDYSRTIHSAASFLLGFLPDRQSLRNDVIIHVSPDIALEAPPPGITAVLPSCEHLRSFRAVEVKETGYYETERTKYHPLFERLSHMFHLNIDNQPIINKVFDSIRTRGCHASNNPLPCYENDCLDYDFSNKLFDFSDWAFVNDVTPNASMVGSQPFLRHSVLGLMEELIQGKDSARKFILSLGHDTGMTDLLMALGVRLDKQMPYASRISFELWKARNANILDKSAYYVRILFNGSPITHKLVAWRAGMVDNQSSELLLYSEFERYLTSGPYRDIQSYNKACRNQS